MTKTELLLPPQLAVLSRLKHIDRCDDLAFVLTDLRPTGRGQDQDGKTAACQILLVLALVA